MLKSTLLFLGMYISNMAFAHPDVISAHHEVNVSAQVVLGKRLFEDKRLSADGTISCASCHIPEKAFADGLVVAKGIKGQTGSRNTPSVLNVALFSSFFWDGRRPTLESQAGDPFTNPREQGLHDLSNVEIVVRADPIYANQFAVAYGIKKSEIDIQHIKMAIAAYERSLFKPDSSFDLFFSMKNDEMLSDSAKRGFRLFKGLAKCATCHTINKPVATFTDNNFHSLGVGYDKILAKLASLTTDVINASANRDDRILSDPDFSELGRFVVTLNPADIAKFRTPSLRNVALTAPYMHDGSVATLDEAVDRELYYRGLESNSPLILTPAEKADIVTFLKSLTSTSFSR